MRGYKVLAAVTSLVFSQHSFIAIIATKSAHLVFVIRFKVITLKTNTKTAFELCYLNRPQCSRQLP